MLLGKENVTATRKSMCMEYLVRTIRYQAQLYHYRRAADSSQASPPEKIADHGLRAHWPDNLTVCRSRLHAGNDLNGFSQRAGQSAVLSFRCYCHWIYQFWGYPFPSPCVEMSDYLGPIIYPFTHSRVGHLARSVMTPSRENNIEELVTTE